MPRTNALEQIENLEELLDRLGGISPRRVRIHPPLGTATEKDLTAILDRTNIICELIDGVLVEKIHSYPEACLTTDIVRLLGHYLDQHDLGNLAGPHGTMRLRPALDKATIFTEADTLDGGKVLPGLSLPVRQIFARTPTMETSPAKTKRTPTSRKQKKGDNS